MWMYLLIMNWNCIIALISIGQVYSQEITCIWNGRLSLNGTYNDSYTRLDTFWEHDGSLIMAKDSAGTITIIDSTYIGRLSEWDRYNAGMLLYNVTDSDAGAYVTRVTFSGGVASYRYSVAVSVVPETEKTVKEAIDKFGYYLIDDQQYDLTEKNSGKTPRNISLTIDLEDANIPPVGIELIIDEEPKACNQPLGYSCSESVDAGKTVVIQIKWQSEEFQYPVYDTVVSGFKILPPTIPPVVITVAITITVCVAAFFCIIKPVKDGRKGFTEKKRYPRRDTWLVLGLAGILVIVIICVVVLVVVSVTSAGKITDDDWTIVVAVNVVFAACCIIAIIVFGCIVDNKFLKDNCKSEERNGATSAASTVTSGAVESRVSSAVTATRVEVSEEPRKQRKSRRSKEENKAIPEPDPSERHGKLDPIYKPGSVPVQDVPSPRRLPDLNSQRSPRPLPGITNNKISPHNSTIEL